MTNPQIDYAAMAAQWRAERETSLKASRAELIAQMRALGISEVTAEYEGYGDSGSLRRSNCRRRLRQRSVISPGHSPITITRGSRTTRAAAAR